MPFIVEAQSTNIHIGYSPIRISLPLFVALEKGYFKDEAIEVELERYDTPQPLMEALAAGRHVMGGYIATPILENVVGRSHEAMTIATGMFEDSEHRFVYLLSDSKNKDLTMNDLVGKKVAVMATTAFREWFRAILDANEIDEKSVLVTPLAPSLMAQALKSGQFDAILAPDPVGAAVLHNNIGKFILGDKVQLYSAIRDPYFIGTFVFRTDFVEANREVTAKIVRVLDRAISFISSNQQEAKKTMIPYLDPAFAPLVEHFPDSLYRVSKDISSDVVPNVVSLYDRNSN